MTALREVRPEELVRAGAVLGQVAEQVGETVLRCKASASVRWNGPPVLRYQEHLSSLVRDLSRIQSAYDAACDALLSYARALEPVRELAVEADLLEAQAEDLKRTRDLTSGMLLLFGPMTPDEESLRMRSAALRADAEDRERSASLRVAHQLRELADDAPRKGGWTSAGRFASQFAQGASDQVAGTVALAGDVWGSVPVVGTAQQRAAARQRLWEDAKALAQPWLAIEELLSRLADGQVGYVGGSLSAAMVLRARGARGKLIDKYGAHDALPLDVLWGLKRGGYGDGDLASIRQWVETRAQKHFVSELLRLEREPLPSLDEMVATGHVDLMLQEAHGGHTLLRHIGRDIDFLRMRQDTEPGARGPISKSSFLDIDEAERLVSAAVQTAQVAIRIWLSTTRRPLKIAMPLSESSGLAIDTSGRLAQARKVIVRLVREGDDSFVVNSAYLEPGGSRAT